MIKAGIIGGAGYTAGELIRLLVNHPEVSIERVVSQSQTGKPVDSVHEDLVGDTTLKFSKDLDGQEDVIFLCMGHGKSREYLDQNPIPANARIIDLTLEVLGRPIGRTIVPNRQRERFRRIGQH